MSALPDEDNLLVQDREDVIAVLRMRFGEIPSPIIEGINRMQQLDALQRLILVAANAADLNVFLEELRSGESSFRLLGERYNPIVYE